MKSYTDLEQSKKLAEILPIESSDMYWRSLKLNGHISWTSHIKRLEPPLYDFEHYAPCWSLAALLNVLPKKYYPIKDHETNLILGKPKNKWCVLYWDTTGIQDGEQTLADNPVDACYEMILKLHKLNLL